MAMKRPYLSVETSEDSESVQVRDVKRKTELKELLLRFVVRAEESQTSTSGQPSYPWLISFLAPLALDHQRKVKANVVISLDDQLEWQANSRSHSPKAPTPPQIMRSLRETPPASPKDSDEDVSAVPAELQPLDVSLALRDVFSAPDGVARLGPKILSLALPSRGPHQLRIRADATVKLPEDVVPAISDRLTAADLWLLGVAVATHDSHFASTVRSRRSLVALPDSLVQKIRAFLFAGDSSREAELVRRREACEAANRRRKILDERIREIQAKIEKLEKIRKSRSDRDIAVSLLKKQERPRPSSAAVAISQPTPAPELSASAELPTATSSGAASLQQQTPVGTAAAGVEAVVALKLGEEREVAVEWLRLNFRARELAEVKSALEKKSRRISVLLAETSKRILALTSPPIKTIPAP